MTKQKLYICSSAINECIYVLIHGIYNLYTYNHTIIAYIAGGL